VRSVLRRSAPAPAAEPAAAHRVAFDDFQLDLSAHRLSQQGVDVALTSGEFRRLKTFIARPNEVLSRDELMNALHGRDVGPFDRAIDVQLGRLRRKLGDDASQPRLIKAVRGEGYLFAAKLRRG
jgi:DNA-binding response OmpR family regulator